MPPQVFPDDLGTPVPSPFVVRIVRERRNVRTRLTPGGTGPEIARVTIVDQVPAGLLEAAAEFVGRMAVQILSGPDSFWPVATGLSKASFYYIVDGTGASIRNYQEYAQYIEQRDQPAERTLRAHEAELERALTNFVVSSRLGL